MPPLKVRLACRTSRNFSSMSFADGEKQVYSNQSIHQQVFTQCGFPNHFLLPVAKVLSLCGIIYRIRWAARIHVAPARQ